MVVVSCLGKFHAFALAEQLNKNNLLSKLYTTYAYQKNQNFRKIAKRIDKEVIPLNLIKTNILVAFLVKGIPQDFIWNDLYDHFVCLSLIEHNDYKVFVGWSSMSLHSIRQAKKEKKITILERGSSHIVYQNRILEDEYKKFGKNFAINPKIIAKELKEYEEADFISIPSMFVKNSFIEMGVSESKLILNNYGSSTFFRKDNSFSKKNKFIILYLGTINIRKGLIYLFKALQLLNIDSYNFEMWFIGKVENELKQTISEYNKPNWIWKGHIPHYELPKWISQCDIAIQPSLEEGLNMVIPQIIACGVPVIASVNSGGEDIIEDAKSGFIVPIRSPQAIADKIELLYNDRNLLQSMKLYSENLGQNNFTWDNYGEILYSNKQNHLIGDYVTTFERKY